MATANNQGAQRIGKGVYRLSANGRSPVTGKFVAKSASPSAAVTKSVSNGASNTPRPGK